MRCRTSLTPLLLAALCAAPALAADWPQWRGPERNGCSSETGLLQDWPEGGPPVAYRADGLGIGFSSVSVAAGRIFTMGDLEDGQYVIALSEKDGQPLWKTRVGGVLDTTYPGPRSTPTVDGDRLFAMATEGVVVSLEVKTGKLVWRRDLVKDFDGVLMKAMGQYDWAYTESPLVDGKRVIVTPGGKEALLVALDRDTGEEVWRTREQPGGERGDDGAAYSSAQVATLAGTRTIVQLVGRGLVGVDASNGKLLWSYNRVANDVANISTPLISGDRVFASTGYGTGSGLILIRRDEQGYHGDEVYFLDAKTIQNHHGGLILHEGTVFTGTGHKKGFPIAVDFSTGKVNWGPQRNLGADTGALSYADGRLYFRYQDGRMILVEASPEAYREHGTFVIPGVERQSWSHPVIANGRLLLREQGTLHVYDLRPGGRETPRKGP